MWLLPVPGPTVSITPGQQAALMAPPLASVDQASIMIRFCFASFQGLDSENTKSKSAPYTCAHLLPQGSHFGPVVVILKSRPQPEGVGKQTDNNTLTNPWPKFDQ